MRALTVLFIVLMSATSVFSADRCISGDCYNGKGAMSYDQGSQYVGDWKNGVPDGQGTMTYSNGLTFYMGDWKNGVPHGKGIMMTQSGSLIHAGFFKNGIPDGR